MLETLRECYDRLQPHSVQIVDLYLFNRASTMSAIISNEKKRLGVLTSPLEELFFAAHDAWRGTPRIMVALDKLLDLPELVRLGGIRHETAHTVLHGSPEYYIFPVPNALRKLERQGIIPNRTLVDVLYLISIAVKDYEVTRLLYSRGYVEDQVAYSRYLLKPTEEDTEAWILAQASLVAKLLVLASVMKPPCCAAPMLRDEKYGSEIEESITQSMSYLPVELSSGIRKVLEKLLLLKEDTHHNVEFVTNEFVEEIWINRLSRGRMSQNLNEN